MAVRWEEAKDDWPDNFDTALEKAFSSICEEQDCDPKDVVKYAWEMGRVTLIMDALDQASEEQIEKFRKLLQTVTNQGRQCRIILTGRTVAIEERRGELLPTPTWRFGKLKPFTSRQQYTFLRGPQSEIQQDIKPHIEELGLKSDPQEALSRFYPAYDEVKDLFANPGSLQMIRELASEGYLTDLHDRTGLYQEVTRRRLERDYLRVFKKENEEVQIRLERMLAAVAFQMLVTDPRSHRVDGADNVRRLREAAGMRLNPPATTEEWECLAKVTVWTNRTLLLAASSKVFAWPDPRMMEFFAGLHLAANQEQHWAKSVKEQDEVVRCGEQAVYHNATRREWIEVWDHAMRIWPERRDDEVLLASLAELFQPVSQKRRSDSEPRILRPTELMYRAWSLLAPLPARECALPTSTVLRHGDRVVRDFRAQFTKQLAAAGETGRIAQELDHDFAVVPALVDQSLELTGNQKISLPSFLLGRQVVTREQYGLFDEAYLKVHEAEIAAFKDRSLQCGAGWINWYDAWCAARFFHGQLPTEAQWEYACGAGSRKNYCRIQWRSAAGYKDLDTAEELKMVADFGRQKSDGPRRVERSLDLPAGMEPNFFGLYGMHGGLWEWCGSWFSEKFSKSEIAGPEIGSYRVRRGGSWRLDADDCRTANRYRSDPLDQGDSLGFRLARVREANRVAQDGSEPERRS